MSYVKIQHPSSMIIAGPSGSGKTVFICNFLHNLDMYDTRIYKVHWYNSQINALPKRDSLPIDLDIQYFSELPLEFTNDKNDPLLVIIDDMMEQAGKSLAVKDLFTKHSHHNSISVCFVTQNYYHKSKYTQDISLNCKYMVLFKTIRGSLQLSIFFRQSFPDNWRQLLKIYKQVTRKPYSYLFIDLTPTTPDQLRFRTDIFKKHYSCYHCTSDLLTSENGAIPETFEGQQIFALQPL